MAVIFIPDRAGQAKVLHSPDGPVGTHLLKMGNQLQRLARNSVGKKTHALERSIHVRLTMASTGLMVRVGSDNRIAYMHHEGTRPHVILPRYAAALRFTVRGRVVFARRVNHPGTRANRYLSAHLATVVLGN